MKLNKVLAVILLVSVIVLGVGYFSIITAGSELPKTSAYEGVEYDFERNVLHDGSLNITNDFNIVNYSWYNGEYPANYSFTDIPVETSKTDIPFIDYVHASLEVCEIISEYDIHKKVLRLDSSVAYTYAYNSFFEIEGVVEFWFNWISGVNNFIISEGSDAMIYIRGYESSIRVYHGATYTDVSASGFNHLKMKFDCGTDTFSLWFNNALKVGDLNFYQNRDCDNITRFQMGVDASGGACIYDAIDFNWTAGYVEGRNRFPEVSYHQTNKVVDRWEFAFEGENDFYDLGDDNPCGWDDVEDGGDDINIIYDGGVSTYDRAVQVGSGGGQTVGLENEVGHINSEKITTTFGFNITEWSTDGGYISFEMYSSTDSEVMHVYLCRIAETIKLYSETDGGTKYIYPGLVIGKYYELEIYIDYFFNTSIVLLKEDGSYVEQYNYEVPLLLGGQVGCNIIKVMLETDEEETMAFELDYVGLYRDIHPGNNDFGYIEQDLFAGNWSLNEFNLLFADIPGYYSLSKYYTELEYDFVPEDILQEILPFEMHYSDEVKNMYGMTEHDGYPSLVFFIKDHINPVELKLEGVLMNDEEEDIILQFLYGGVNIDESYFYVSGTSLRWTMTVNDSGAEYITANFDIEDISCENKSFSFASDTEGNSYGDIQLFYTDLTSTYFPVVYYYRTTSSILPQERSVGRITLYIYDNDEYESEVFYGYIQNVQIIEYSSLILSIGIIDLIGIIIPLIIMIVPPLAVSRKFGNKAILPMFVLMTVICFVTALIPAWLFFVIAFGLVGFIFMKRKRKKGSGP